MARQTVFSRLLDEKLCESVRQDRDRQASRIGAAPAPPHPLLFSRPFASFRAAAYSSDTATPGSDTATPRTPPPPHRTLTAAEQQALDVFAELGAALTADFTARELRSAFRALARRYHPDRHTASGETENARLTRVFATIAEHHRRLALALDR